MINYFNPFVTVFSRVHKDKTPIWDGPLSKILEQFKAGKWLPDIQSVQRSRDMNKAKENQLPVFTVAGLFDCIAIKGLRQYNHLVALDYDDVGDCSTYKVAAAKLPYTYAVFSTPSGKGFKVLVRLADTCKPENHAESLDQVTKFYNARLGLKHCKNGTSGLARVCYVSADPELFLNPEPRPFAVVQQLALQPSYNHDHTEYLVRFTESHPGAGVYGKDNRNNFLFWLACNCFRYGLTRSETETICREQWLANTEDFPWDEVEKVVRSAKKKTAHEFGKFKLPSQFTSAA